MSLTSELLPRAADAGDADEHAERNLDVDVLEIVVRRRRRSCSLFSLGARRVRRDFDLALAREKLPGDAALLFADLVERACDDDLAAAHAGAGAEVDDVVGGPHRVFVMLDDDDRVAQVAQPFERAEQAIVVARMQADRRFVENVEHADQAAADLAGEANALRFAAGERRRGAVEREVFEADVGEEAEPAADFFEHFGGDGLLRGVELELAEEIDGVGDAAGEQTSGRPMAGG